jgi:hypothetical protein
MLSLLLPQQETQFLCQLLQDRTASRNRWVSSKIGEAGNSDEHHGAKAKTPMDWRRANTLALPEACRRDRGGSIHLQGRWNPKLAQAKLQDGALHSQPHGAAMRLAQHPILRPINRLRNILMSCWESPRFRNIHCSINDHCATSAFMQPSSLQRAARPRPPEAPNGLRLSSTQRISGTLSAPNNRARG